MSFTQSFCYPCFLEKDGSLDALFAGAAAAGYKAAELWFRDEGFDNLVATAQKHGLTIPSMCGHRPVDGVGMNNTAAHESIIRDVKESIDIAARLGIKGLIVFSGNRIEGQSREQSIENCAACLRQLAPYAEKHNINLNMELLNSKVNHPGYECDNTPFGVEICKRAGSPNVKLLYDIYHMQIMEGDVIRTITDHIQHIGHFHTAGNPGRHDLDDQQELHYPAICKAINQTGYDLYLAHEFHPKGDRLAALKAAFDTCNV